MNPIWLTYPFLSINGIKEYITGQKKNTQVLKNALSNHRYQCYLKLIIQTTDCSIWESPPFTPPQLYPFPALEAVGQEALEDRDPAYLVLTVPCCLGEVQETVFEGQTSG